MLGLVNHAIRQSQLHQTPQSDHIKASLDGGLDLPGGAPALLDEGGWGYCCLTMEDEET